MSSFKDNKDFEEMLKKRIELTILKETLKEGNKRMALDFVVFIILGVIILYWFFPLTIDIINDKIIEEYNLLPNMIVAVIPQILPTGGI